MMVYLPNLPEWGLSAYRNGSFSHVITWHTDEDENYIYLIDGSELPYSHEIESAYNAQYINLFLNIGFVPYFYMELAMSPRYSTGSTYTFDIPSQTVTIIMMIIS